MKNLGFLIIFYLVLTTVYFPPCFYGFSMIFSTISSAFYTLKTSTFPQISFHFHQFNATYYVGHTLQYVKPSPKH